MRPHSLNISNEEFSIILSAVEESFSTNWLTKETNNPIQKLWNRKDILSSNELYSLGCSLKTINKLNPNWLKQQVKIIKGTDENNRNGALFEIFALNILHNELLHPISPARKNQSGYDAILNCADDLKLRVSVKNYGKSGFQKDFETQCENLVPTIKRLLEKYSYPPSQVFLDFQDYYPNLENFKRVKSDLDIAFKTIKDSKEKFYGQAELIDKSKERSVENTRVNFILIISPLPIEDLDDNYTSFTFISTAKYHNNENRNLYSKIDKACENLAKHSNIESDLIKNILIIKIPNTISLEISATWVKDYFIKNPQKPISMIILYQTAVSHDLGENNYKIIHSINTITNNNFVLKQSLKCSVPVGLVSLNSTFPIFIFLNPDGTQETLEIKNKYYYQNGVLYKKFITNSKGESQGEITTFASGIKTKLVGQLPNSNEKFIMEGKFPPKDEVLII
jgi:hypothetical protein